MTAERDDNELVLVDGRSVLAYVFIKKPETGEEGLVLEAASRGITKPEAAQVLRFIADRWEREAEPEPEPAA